MIDAVGLLYCWGENTDGQVGAIGASRVLSPTPVAALGGIAVSVSAASIHTCALLSDGRIRCFGANGDGQLGDGTTAASASPVDAFGIGAATAVAAGRDHTCAINAAGGVVCWGKNHAGQLGDGTATSRRTPVDVVGLTSGVTAISAGREHTCALTSLGEVLCWGKGSHGRLGVGTQNDRRVPTAVPGLGAGVVAVSAGREHTCAVTLSGGVKCWGGSSAGQLGDGTTTDRLVAVDVVGLASGVAAIHAGREHTCATMAHGTLRCWGKGKNGRLGDGAKADRTTPVDVFGLTAGTARAAAGGFHTCTQLTNGALWCWGYGSFGQLGTGSTRDEALPVALAVP